MDVLNFILDVVKTPALILGLVALIGLAIQRKSGPQIFAGTVKTALGMLVLTAGSGLVVVAIGPFVTLFQGVFGLAGFATGSELVSAAMQKSVPVTASSSAITMGIGFVVNVLPARVTPARAIFLTGHMMWIASVVVAYVLYSAGWSEGTIIVVGSVVQAALLTFLPPLPHPPAP